MPVLVATPVLSPRSTPLLSRSPSFQQLPQISFPTVEETPDADSGASSSGTAVPFPKISHRRKRYRGVGTQPWHYRDSASDSDSDTDEATAIPSPPVNTPTLQLQLPEPDVRRTVSESQIQTPPALSLRGHIRKKSGEIVKSSLKSPSVSSQGFPGRISMPTTPSLEKFVHFNSKLEDVRLFNKEQKPKAVSRDGSPCDSEDSEADDDVRHDGIYYPGSSEDERIRLSLAMEAINVPIRHPMVTAEQVLEYHDVKLERVSLASGGRSVDGSIFVRNIAFEKWVAVRFTFDWWQTTSEVTAKYASSVPGANVDIFTFSIRLPDVIHRIEEKRLFLAIRYTAAGKEEWDNCNGENYQLRFKRESKPVHPPSWPVKTGNVDQMADLRRELERVVREDEESSGLSSWNVLTARLRAKNIDMEEDRDAQKELSLRKRYDFGASSKEKWEPPKDLPKYMGHPNISFPNSRPTTKSSAPSIQLPSLGVSSWRSPRASPGDVDVQHSPKFFLDPREGRNGHFSPRHTPPSPHTRTRLHQRGGSYFDTWADTQEPTAKVTPTTTDSALPVASSSTESITTEESQRTEETSETEGYASSLASSSATSIADMTPLGFDVSDSNSTIIERIPVRFNSYPMDRTYMGSASGVGSPSAGLPPSLAGNAAAQASSPWLFSPTGSSVATTPSITSASSPSQCPSSPSETLSDSIRNVTAAGGPLDSMDYNYFLSRFCYYTGHDAHERNGALYGGMNHRHSQSNPAVGSSWVTSGSGPSSPPLRRHSLDGTATQEGFESGHTTPTRSTSPNGRSPSPGKSAGMLTPRPGSPTADSDKTPRITYEGFVRPFRGSL